MLRPPSIIRYEKLYLTALAFGFANTALGWPQSVASFASNPTLVRMMWILPASVVAGLVLRITLWYFTARQPSVTAKCVATAMAVISAIILLFGVLALVSGASPALPAAITGIVSGALYIAAATYLFRPDARAWFGESDYFEQDNQE